MNKYQIEAMRKSATFLYEHRIPRNFLWNLLDESFKVHKWMGETFNLKEENDYRTILPIPEDGEENRMIRDFVQTLCEIKNKEDGANTWSMIDGLFIQDNRKNKYRITRILTPDLWRELWKTPKGRNMAQESGQYTCCLDCTIGDVLKLKDFVRRFNIWYGDQVKSDRQIALSCHPVDILTASSNCSFSSCYRPDGEWFNGVLATMLSGESLIASVEGIDKPGYKIGRSWVYVNEDIICVGRPYGNINVHHNFIIRNYLYGKMGGKWTHKPSLRMDNRFVKMVGPGFLDASFGDITIAKGKPLSSVKCVIIPKSICLYCGLRFNNYGAKGVCLNCAKTISPEELAE